MKCSSVAVINLNKFQLLHIHKERAATNILNQLWRKVEIRMPFKIAIIFKDLDCRTETNAGKVKIQNISSKAFQRRKLLLNFSLLARVRCAV